MMLVGLVLLSAFCGELRFFSVGKIITQNPGINKEAGRTEINKRRRFRETAAQDGPLRSGDDDGIAGDGRGPTVGIFDADLKTDFTVHGRGKGIHPFQGQIRPGGEIIVRTEG